MNRPRKKAARRARRAVATLCIGALVELGSLSAPAVANAQQPAPAAPALTPPSLVSRVEATYPEAALRDRLEATVGLELTIDAQGKVSAARVTAPAGHGFDEAALAAVKQFMFVPAKRGGIPITSTVQLGFDFHLPRPDVPPPPPIEPAPTARPEQAPATAAAPIVTQDAESTIVVAKAPRLAPNQEPEPIAASDSTTTQEELSLRPRYRTEQLVEVVPGLFAVQHAGGGKSDQFFLRGFDLDHGTDLAQFADGVPINAVSHAHGQGYSDLHFIIPETVEAVEATKGPYSARVGDFATAGSVNYHFADHAPESFARSEIGQYGHLREVVLESPDLGPKWRMLLAAEAFNTNDGPFIHPTNYDRLNAYMKVAHVLDDKSEASLIFQAYGGTWNMSGVLPARAVCGEGDGTPVPAAYAGSNCINRWDSIDPSQGGASQRIMTALNYRRRIERGDLDSTLYMLGSNLQLIPNDGIAASFQPAGLQYGSEVEQDDTRLEMGSNTRVSKYWDVGGTEVRSTVGLQIRYDDIHSQLHRDEDRHWLDGMPGIPGPIIDSGVNETEIGVYAEEDWKPAKWVRFILGGRIDRVDVNVANESTQAVDKVEGYKGATQGSPKASMVISPIDQIDLFANYGRGFHTNDARTLIEGSATTLVATATGYEVGTTLRPLPKRYGSLSLSAVAFLLDLQSELVIDGDDASTDPSGPTRRYGGEFTLRYDYEDTVFADAAFTATHARYTDGTDIAAGTDLVELAPIRTFSASIGARQKVGDVTLTGSVNTRSMSNRYATSDGSLIATGFTLFNADLAARYKWIEIGGSLMNIGNVDWRDGQFAVNSRLPKEGPNPDPVDGGMSFTPGIPRMFIGHATLFW